MCRHTPALQADLPSTMQAARLAPGIGTPDTVLAHAEHLRQVAALVTTELVTDAVGHGRMPIALSVDCVFGQGVVLAVSDTGPRFHAGARLVPARWAAAGCI